MRKYITETTEKLMYLMVEFFKFIIQFTSETQMRSLTRAQMSNEAPKLEGRAPLHGAAPPACLLLCNLAYHNVYSLPRDGTAGDDEANVAKH